MYSTQAYIYQQITRVLLIDTGSGETFTYRYNPVYAKQLTINKGVDNVLLFEFINQQEKPVNINGSNFLFRGPSSFERACAEFVLGAQTSPEEGIKINTAWCSNLP